MTTEVLILLIPVLALVIGLVATIRMPRRALAPKSTADLEARVQALEHDLVSLRQELAEAHERLDFSERLLARTTSPRE